MADEQWNSSVTNASEPSEPAPTRLRCREAYQRVLTDHSAVAPTKLLVINIDVRNAFTTVLGALGRINTFRERASQLPEFDVKNVDNLEVFALALMHVQDEYVSASADAIQKRLLVFTLLVNAYDQARRAISFLRWRDGDLEEIAPSLYAGRRRKKGEPEQPGASPTTPPPDAITAPQTG